MDSEITHAILKQILEELKSLNKNLTKVKIRTPKQNIAEPIEPLIDTSGYEALKERFKKEGETDGEFASKIAELIRENYRSE
jgi:hypothetical protein